jgi:hypothetical protein
MKPVDLDFKLNKTKIHVGEHLFFKATIANNGKNPIRLDHDMFDDIRNYAFNMRRADENKSFGLYFKVTDPRGRRMKGRHMMFNACGIAGLETEKGLSLAKPAEVKDSLMPGESVATPTWVFTGTCGGLKPLPVVSGFAELYIFDFEKPGTYHITAYYENRDVCKQPGGMGDKIADELCKKYPRRSSPEEVLIQTPAIAVEVVR